MGEPLFYINIILMSVVLSVLDGTERRRWEHEPGILG